VFAPVVSGQLGHCSGALVDKFEGCFWGIESGCANEAALNEDGEPRQTLFGRIVHYGHQVISHPAPIAFALSWANPPATSNKIS
jgi:hypothetical protein